MSREFGIYGGCGYFHTKIESAANDCKEEGRLKLTRLWGKWLESFYDIARVTSSSEAGDSGEHEVILTTLFTLPKLELIMQEIKDYLAPFEDVIDHVVAESIERVNREGEEGDDE